MIRYQKKKEGLLGRNWVVQPAPLADGMILDRMSLSDIPSNSSRVYVEVPAGHVLVHKDSPFDPFYLCTPVDNRYMTDASKVQVSPIFMLPERLGHQSIPCGGGFDVEVLCPDYVKPIPARVSIQFSYTPRILNHAKLVTALHDRAPLDAAGLENVLQEDVRFLFNKAFKAAIENRPLTLEQINSVISGEAGIQTREEILSGMREKGSMYGLVFDCSGFTLHEIFDRPGSNAWEGYGRANELEITHAISIRTMTDNTNYIKAINENKRALEDSDRELDESRKKK